MKAFYKKRIESLENFLNMQSKRKQFAKVVCIPGYNFDSATIKVDAKVVLILPDNGRRGISKSDFDHQNYKIFYG